MANLGAPGVIPYLSGGLYASLVLLSLHTSGFVSLPIKLLPLLGSTYIAFKTNSPLEPLSQIQVSIIHILHVPPSHH